MLYPLKFKPQFKEKVWGGNRISKIKKAYSVPDMCGESWEISGVQDNLSVVENGFLKDNNIQELIEIYMGELVGEKVYEKFGIEFPLLFKIIDADDDLSVQVHPDDEFARTQHNAYGKNEAWYILETVKSAKIILGFNKNITKKDFYDLAKENNIISVLNHKDIKPGEVYSVPAGRIHAIGKGTMLAEIQQTSDVTYRIYDYNRKGDRELHIDLASEVLDFTKTEKSDVKFNRIPDKSNIVINNEKFVLNFLPLMNPVAKDYSQIDSFIIYYCINGGIDIHHEGDTYSLNKGESILIPAEIPSITINPVKYSELLEIYMDI